MTGVEATDAIVVSPHSGAWLMEGTVSPPLAACVTVRGSADALSAIPPISNLSIQAIGESSSHS
jgi:hypothetical protein